ncbi:MAG: lincosamide nucleotidyltransferase [Nocardioidaceae bacterium]|nr:lincosamide nucleotidyltransferase [Nocardioidaceae bacterium]
MQLSEVLRVLEALEGEDIPTWVGGGWGVDALAGRQTREHRDLDVLVDRLRLDDCLRVLEDLGYVTETDWLPIRVEVASSLGWVDVHPIAIAADGSAVQAGPDGSTFDYPADAFTVATLAGVEIACISRAHQIAFHLGYEPRPQDEHDLRILRRIVS